MNGSKLVGMILRERREELDLKQERIAAAIGKKGPALSKYERGLAPLRLDHAQRLAEELGWTFEELLRAILHRLQRDRFVSLDDSHQQALPFLIGEGADLPVLTNGSNLYPILDLLISQLEWFVERLKELRSRVGKTT